MKTDIKTYNIIHISQIKQNYRLQLHRDNDMKDEISQ